MILADGWLFANPPNPLKCNISPPDEDILPDTLKSLNEDETSENCIFVCVIDSVTNVPGLPPSNSS